MTRTVCAEEEKQKVKRLTIRTKITLWFSVAFIIIIALTCVLVLGVSNQVLQKSIRDSLIEMVEDSTNDIDYYDNIDDVDTSGDLRYYIRYNEGYLEIDNSFLIATNQVYTSLYLQDGSMLYGENPVARYTKDIGFSDSEIQRITVNGTIYFIYDRKLSEPGLEGLWLRGVVSEKQGEVQMNSISRTTLIILPSLVLLAIVGGYIVAGRMLRPVRKITDSAAHISEGGDLKKRIEIGEGKDELLLLADSFNKMFDRLDASFQTEKQFTSDASHELRTPVAVILAQCELSLDTPQSNEEYRNALSVIQRQGKKMSKLINDMLVFTRLELKSEQYVKTQLDLGQLTEDVCTDMSLIKENNITLKYRTIKPLMYYGNKELLTRLLTNLISNAYRYGKNNGNIYVTLTEKENETELSVKDDGIGIAEKDIKKIFDRFYQADNSRSNTGTGLGLSMVKEIAKMHDGEVSVESEPGKGSTFTLHLPHRKSRE